MTAGRGPKSIVVDASVALKWYLTESGNAQALKWYKRLRKGQTVGIVPDFFFIEVMNVLTAQYKFGQPECETVLADLNRLSLEVVPMASLKIEELVAHALRLRVTIYDALYLETAMITGALVLTADRRLRESAPEYALRI